MGHDFAQQGELGWRVVRLKNTPIVDRPRTIVSNLIIL